MEAAHLMAATTLYFRSASSVRRETVVIAGSTSSLNRSATRPSGPFTPISPSAKSASHSISSVTMSKSWLSCSSARLVSSKLSTTAATVSLPCGSSSAHMLRIG